MAFSELFLAAHVSLFIKGLCYVLLLLPPISNLIFNMSSIIPTGTTGSTSLFLLSYFHFYKKV